MEKDLVFFDEQGLTSTSANHIANLAKEYVAGLEESIDGVTLYNTKASLLIDPSGNKCSLVIGNTLEDIEDIKNKAMHIAEAKSLIAWLREAIKAKLRLVGELTTKELDEYCLEQGKELPKMPYKKEYTNDDEIANMTIKERNHHFEVQTYATVFGKIVHPDGPLAKARKAMLDKIKQPNVAAGEGRDTIIYSSSPTVKEQDVEDVFFQLQGIQRSYQAEYNKITHSIEERVFAENAKRNAEYSKKLEEYKAQTSILSEEFSAYTQSETKRISELKIVIPDELQGIYQTVNSIGKKR